LERAFPICINIESVMSKYDVYVVSFCLGEGTNIFACSFSTYVTFVAIITDVLRNGLGAHKDNEILTQL
jgi:hypothetical protein